MSNSKESAANIHARSGDSFYHLDSFLSSSADFHENQRPLLSYWEQEKAEKLEKKRMEEALATKKLEEENLRQYKALHDPLDQRISEWRKENNPHNTRAILKIINNTDHAFQLTKTSRPLTPAQMEKVYIPPREPIALILTPPYYGFEDGEDITNQFQHYLNFTGKTAGFKLIVGLIVERGFNRLFGNWREPHWVHNISSTGETDINCSATVTAGSNSAPYNFEVLVVLG